MHLFTLNQQTNQQIATLKTGILNAHTIKSELVQSQPQLYRLPVVPWFCDVFFHSLKQAQGEVRVVVFHGGFSSDLFGKISTGRFASKTSEVLRNDSPSK